VLLIQRWPTENSMGLKSGGFQGAELYTRCRLNCVTSNAA
jgi:hypothetical protein